jgi:hypothetical protein
MRTQGFLTGTSIKSAGLNVLFTLLASTITLAQTNPVPLIYLPLAAVSAAPGATVPAADLATASTVLVTVTNPTPGGGYLTVKLIAVVLYLLNFPWRIEIPALADS